MWEKVGIVRRKRELISALNYLENQKKQLGEINIVKNLKTNQVIKIIGDSITLRNFFEVNNLIEIGIIITKATLARSKSLGAHYIK